MRGPTPRRKALAAAPRIPAPPTDCHCVPGTGGVFRLLRSGARAHTPSGWRPPQRPPFPISRDAGASSWAAVPVEYAPSPRPPPRARPPACVPCGEPTSDLGSGAPGRRPWRGHHRGPCLPPAQADCHCGPGRGGARRFLRAGARAYTPSAQRTAQPPPSPYPRVASAG